MTTFFVRFWVFIATVLVGAGWILSALHCLNRTGYAVGLLLVVLAVAGTCRSWRKDSARRSAHWPRLRRRFTRGFPCAFLLIGVLIVVGACLYGPSNYDALSYRVPRTLNWLAAEQWHWIHTGSNRLNVRPACSEWLMAPGLLFFHSERIAVVENLMMFALLPGLIFSVYRRSGISPRVAWLAMWLGPTGYVFVTQAGGTGNDIGSAFFALAAVDLALRARVTQRFGDLALSLCAVALLSAVKMNNAPLGLVWLVVVWPVWRLALARPFATVGVALIAMLVSFLPTAILNFRFGGDWTGAKLELPATVTAQPGIISLTNTVGIVLQNIVPPIFPWAGHFTRLSDTLFPAEFNRAVVNGYGTNWSILSVEELQFEDSAGLGCGLTVLFAVTVVAILKNRPAGRQSPLEHSRRALHWAPWIGLVIVLANLGVTTEARLATGYYAFLALGVLASPTARAITTRPWWRWLAWLQVGSAAVLVVVTPPRPLWPALTVLDSLAAAHPTSTVINRARLAFSVYRERNDALAPVRALLPPEVRVCGLVTHNDPEASLWRPFGTRSFQHIVGTDTRADLEAFGIEYVVVHEESLRHTCEYSFEEWRQRIDAGEVSAVSVRTLTSGGIVPWRLVRLRHAPATPASTIGH